MLYFVYLHVFGLFAGVEKLMEVYQNRPNFADADAQEDARLRLIHVSQLITVMRVAVTLAKFFCMLLYYF